MSSPLPADYIHREAVGMGTSMQGLGLIFGEVISMGVLFRLTANMDPTYGFAIAAGVGLLFSFILLFIVKEPQLRSNKNSTKVIIANNPIPMIGLPYDAVNTSVDEGST